MTATPAVRIEYLFDQAAMQWPDRLALVCGTRRWTYRALQAESMRVAARLVEAGVQVNDVIVLYQPVTDDSLIALLAAFYAGAAVLTASPLLTLHEIDTIMRQAQTKWYYSQQATLTSGTNLATLQKSDPSQEAVAEVRQRMATADPAAPAQVRTSSGTTSAVPKLAVRLHGQLTSSPVARLWWQQEGIVFASSLTNQLGIGQIVATFMYGATYVVPIHPLQSLEGELAAQGVNTLYTSPAHLAVLTKQTTPPPEHLRLTVVRSVGAILADETREAAVARYGVPIVTHYGQSEVRNVFNDDPQNTPRGSIGHPYPQVEVQLLDDDEQPVAAGTVGEIVLRSPWVTAGYLFNPEATADVVRGDWYFTGDLARCDEAGFFYLVGRKGLQINVGGAKVVPEEVELVLEQHPGIREAVVLAAPDEVRGEVVRAVIVPADPQLTATMVQQFCRERLASYKVPRIVEFRDTPLPRSATGKVRRTQV